MLVTLEAQGRGVGSLKNTPALLSAEALSPPLIVYPDFTYEVAWWMTKLLVQICLQRFIVEPRRLLNETRENFGAVLIFRVHMFAFSFTLE